MRTITIGWIDNARRIEMIRRVSKVEVDDRSGELYWRQEEIVARFIAFQEEVYDMIDTRMRLSAGDLRLGRNTEEYVEGYVSAFEDYTEELDFILHHRFKEIMKIIEKKDRNNNDDKLDLGEI